MEANPLTHDFWPQSDSRFKSIAAGVIHYTGGRSVQGDLNYLDSLDKDHSKSASYNFLLGEGRDIQLVDFETGRAWHAGKSQLNMGKHTLLSLNPSSIGIAVSNPGWTRTPSEECYIPAPLPGTGDIVYWAPYNRVDISNLIKLVVKIHSAIGRSIPWVGHSDVSPMRKQDPGPLFPWSEFHEGVSGHMGKPEAHSALDYLEKARVTARSESVTSDGIRLVKKIEDAIAWSVYTGP